MEPLPETRHALGGLGSAGGEKLSRLLDVMGQQVRAVVPDCVGLSITSLDGKEPLTFTLAASSVELWQLLAQVSAAKGVRSTLSLPLWKNKRIIGGINLHGASARAFVGSEDELGAILELARPCRSLARRAGASDHQR